jgi:MOSC domain-containing protein YiiM
MGRVLSVQVGRVGTLGPQAMRSAFIKTPCAGPVAVGRLGLAGDMQGNPRVHGGPDKAVYVYPFERYALWQERFPLLAPMFAPGGLGENLTSVGIDEEAVCVDDIFAVGTARLQVSEPRIPCRTIAARFGDDRVGRLMRDSGWRGFYCRVLEDGLVRAGDAMTLIERPKPGTPIADIKPGRGAAGLDGGSGTVPG